MVPKSPRRARSRRARPRLGHVAAASLLAAGALAGCGGTASSSSSSGPSLQISSPAITGQSIPARYTCAGKNTSPPLQWGNVPSRAAELILFLLDLGHTEAAAGGATQAKFKVGWAVRGLKPTLHGMAAGGLPAGTIAGHGHYSICPPKGGTGEYMFRMYALPAQLQVKGKPSDLALFRKVNRLPSSVGYFLASYTRPKA